VLFTAFAEAGRLNLARYHLAGIWLKPIDLDALLDLVQGVLHRQPSGVRVLA